MVATYICIITRLCCPLEFLNMGHLNIVSEVFTTSVYNNRINSHSPFQDSRLLVATLHFLTLTIHNKVRTAKTSISIQFNSH